MTKDPEIEVDDSYEREKSEGDCVNQAEENPVTTREIETEKETESTES